jgi:hypothetical protein
LTHYDISKTLKQIERQIQATRAEEAANVSYIHPERSCFSMLGICDVRGEQHSLLCGKITAWLAMLAILRLFKPCG